VDKIFDELSSTGLMNDEFPKKLKAKKTKFTQRAIELP
jgi:hypothetical protein